MILVDIYTQHPILGNQTLTYTHDIFLERGIRCWVELVNKKIVGFVMRSYEGEVEFDVKPIESVIDDSPILNDELYQLATEMSQKTLSPIIRCFQAILPNQLRPKSNHKTIQTTDFVRVIDTTGYQTKRQQEVLEDLNQYESLDYSNALNKYKTVLKTLIDNGAVERFNEVKKYVEKEITIQSQNHQLTKTQQQALDAVVLNQNHTYLLFGATGSGKTEVYLQLASKVLQNKQQVLILVPEISLTPQMIERFQSRFGQDIGIYHSGLNDQEKYEQYLRVKNNEVLIVVGTRSCSFLPFENLGLIVMDEEHDPSFKQESVPFYHALDVCLWRSHYHNCPLMLGSATPSLESYAKAYKGIYKLLALPKRINNNFPKITIVDTSKNLRKLEYEVLSNELKTAIQETLQRKEQIILLLNRRSYSPIVQCENCLEVLMCPDCDTALSYHKDTHHYQCHTCGYQQHDNKCPKCHHRASLNKGLGTQRLEEIVCQLFPQAKVSRMDADSTRLKNAHFKILDDFSSHRTDILIGTQMIAKGLDIPNVTLVAILKADSALYHEDFSSSEQAFSLILQASGRAGRHDKQGHVIIQSFSSDHYVLQYALYQNYLGFFNQEMKYRQSGQYPPYVYMTEIMFSHLNKDKTIETADLFSVEYRKIESLKVLGPVAIRKLAKIERVRVVVKSKNFDEMIQTLTTIHSQLENKLKGVKVVYNVKPLHLTT